MGRPVIVLRGGHVCDPATGFDGPADVLIDGNTVAAEGAENSPHQLTDLATYRDPTRPAQGVRHLLVGGTFVVRDGALRPEVRPGRAVRGV